MSLLVAVIPAKDEEATLGELLDRIFAAGVDGHRTEVVVVDDGSRDATAEIARQRGARVVGHPQSRGLGAAVRSGLAAAVELGASVVCYLDADLEYYPEDIPRVVEPILSGRAEYVSGDRFHEGGVRGMELRRRVGNAVFSALLSVLCRRRIRDGQSGIRAFSRRAAASAEIVHDYNYAQVLTLDLLGKGFSMEEVPVRYRLRRSGESFICWSYPAKVLPAMWRELRGP